MFDPTDKWYIENIVSKERKTYTLLLFDVQDSIILVFVMKMSDNWYVGSGLDLEIRGHVVTSIRSVCYESWARTCRVLIEKILKTLLNKDVTTCVDEKEKTLIVLDKKTRRRLGQLVQNVSLLKGAVAEIRF